MRNNCAGYFLIGLILCAGIFACDKRESDTAFRNPYPDEAIAKIERGLVAFRNAKGRIFLSWRMLPGDPNPAKYKIWRKKSKNPGSAPELMATTTQTHLIYQAPAEEPLFAYGVQAEGEALPKTYQTSLNTYSPQQEWGALSFDIGVDYKLARVATGDLTGDGELEIIIGYSEMHNVDPYEKAWQKSTDTIKVAAFKRNGERLWEIDLGFGIEAGGVYAPMVVWDVDADGSAELLLKTNRSSDPKDYTQEYISLLNGQTGETIREARWPIIEGVYADDYNNNSRNYIAIAHLDGTHPTIIATRGLYKTQVISAYDSELNKKWERVLGRHIRNPFRQRYLRRIWNWFATDQGKGSHSLPIADVDENGTEEILWGERCIGLNGKNLWVVKDRMPYRGHPDIVFAADLLPDKQGKEIFYSREGWYRHGEDARVGMLVVDNSGKTEWAKWDLSHVDGGWVARVVPDRDDLQCFAYDISEKKWKSGDAEHVGTAQMLFGAAGDLISHPPASWIRSFPVDWEGDDVREICLEDGSIRRHNDETVAAFQPGLIWGGDLFGDHREEVVWAPQDGKVYILFNTAPMENQPRITRLADRQYRNDLSRTAMQFNVVPTESGYLTVGQ